MYVVPEADQGRTVELRMPDRLIVHLQNENPFLQGLHIEILLSDTLRQHTDDLLLVISKGVPEQILVALPLQHQNKTELFIPLKGSGEAEEASDSVFAPVDPSEFPVTIAMQTRTEDAEIPEETKYFVVIRYDVENRGRLEVNVRTADGSSLEAVTVHINGDRITDHTVPIELEAGTHRLRVASPSWDETTMVFTILPGQDTALAIVLRRSTPLLALDVPETASVFLDGAKMEFKRGERRSVEAGDHIIRVKIGDYTITRKFRAVRGRVYTVSLFFDILIVED